MRQTAEERERRADMSRAGSGPRSGRESARRVVALYFYNLGRAGGAERMICMLADALAERGFETHLVSWDAADASTFYPLSPRVIWHRLGYRPGWLDKLRRARQLARRLRRERVDLLIGFVMSGDKTIYAAAKLAGIRLVAAERNAPSMYHLRYGRLQRWASFAFLHLVDRIIVQIPEFADGYPRSLRGRIEAIPNPVAAAAGRARPDRAGPTGRFTLLAVGRLDGVQKRMACLVRAYSRIAAAHPDWDLRIVGAGPEDGALRALIGRSGLAARIRLEPSAPDIFAVYAEAHLFAIPSRWEGFPNALAEAMSHGLPAIGFREAAGVAHLIDDGRTGWLAPGSNDAAALAQALASAMSDGAERARRGRLAAERMAAYAPERQFERWAAMIETVAGDRPR